MPQNFKTEVEELKGILGRFKGIFLLLNVLTILLILYLIAKTLEFSLIDRYDLAGVLLITAVCVMTCLIQLYYMRKTELESRVKLNEISVIDPLTNTYDQKYVEKQLEREVQRCERYNRSTAVLYIEINDFETIAESYGQDVSGKIVVQIAGNIKSFLRSADSVGRMGDGEFMVVLPNTGLAGAHSTKDRIKRSIGERTLTTPKGKEISRIACGVGMATFPADGKAATELVRAASLDAARDRGASPELPAAG